MLLCFLRFINEWQSNNHKELALSLIQGWFVLNTKLHYFLWVHLFEKQSRFQVSDVKFSPKTFLIIGSHLSFRTNSLWGTVRNVYRERPTLKMTPPTKFQNFGILEEFWWRKQVFSSNRLRILRKSIWGVVKWEGQNGTWTPLTEIAAIWVVWDLDTNGFLLLFPHIHSKKYICQSHYKMSI